MLEPAADELKQVRQIGGAQVQGAGDHRVLDRDDLLLAAAAPGERPPTGLLQRLDQAAGEVFAADLAVVVVALGVHVQRRTGVLERTVRSALPEKFLESLLSSGHGTVVVPRLDRHSRPRTRPTR